MSAEYDEAHALAVAAMDRAFGRGLNEAHALLRTNAVAKRIYDCAIIALIEQKVGPAPLDLDALASRLRGS